MTRYVNADLILGKTQKELDVLMRIYNRHKSVLSDKMLTRLGGVIHGLESVRYRIKNAPTEDVREVTLCKNCKNAKPYWIEGTIFCEDSGCPNLEDGFCNHAEPICEVLTTANTVHLN